MHHLDTEKESQSREKYKKQSYIHGTYENYTSVRKIEPT